MGDGENRTRKKGHVGALVGNESIYIRGWPSVKPVAIHSRPILSTAPSTWNASREQSIDQWHCA